LARELSGWGVTRARVSLREVSTVAMEPSERRVRVQVGQGVEHWIGLA